MRPQFRASGSYLGSPDWIESELFDIPFETGSSLMEANFRVSIGIIFCFEKKEAAQP